MNKWERYETWPPKVGFKEEKLFLTAGGGLGVAAPTANDAGGKATSSYRADPANPVPYRDRPIQSTYGDGSKWRTWLVEDQRFVSGRKDLANFQLRFWRKM